MSTYSKAAQGLFVLPWLVGIFTDTIISPGLSLRQFPYHYAIRAGRNLPDKEFRSTIVTYGVVISATLCMSPCRSDYIFTFDPDLTEVSSV